MPSTRGVSFPESTICQGGQFPGIGGQFETVRGVSLVRNLQPYFNKMFADTLSTLVVLGKNKTYHRDLVDIYSLSIQIDNGVTYLRMADWEDGDVDFYVRQN
jgi:hypothetical protein